MFDIKEVPWCSNHTLSINREKNRAHYITYSDREKYDFEGPKTSDRCVLLNGEWDFEWFSTPLEVNKKLLEGKEFSKKINVPLNWQFAGYGAIHYTDEMYPFPIDPPYVPMTNECGVYHRTIQINNLQDEKAQWSYYLNFEGVESAFFVYVNGSNVGFNQGSRMHSEFDITSYLQEGANELVIQVLQYSSATYLEDQDQWWLGGIIRDVYLLKRPKEHITNVNFETDFNALDNTGSITVTLSVTGNLNTEVELIDASGTSLFHMECSLQNCEFTFTKELNDIKGWNAEQPYLYQLLVKDIDQEKQIKEIIPFQVGFRSLVIKNGILLWNNKRILMKGVNRHEFNAFTGRAVTYEQTKSELLLIKSAGMNAVRTAHYPNNPYFYDLCDRLGLYIIDEADLETHGFEILGEPTTLCEDLDWQDAYLDRVQRMVERDRNHVCIVLWSLGNESSYGRNFKAMYDWVKENEPVRPVHYEGDYKNQSIDVSSTMYSTVGRLAELDTNSNPLRPHILCEFAHAMGNGPGSLSEYFDLIENSKRIQGCFVWEFKDHGICRDISKKEEAYLYGGDFGEKYHNGNFCLDGLVRSNGEPSPAFYEYQKVIEDIHVLEFDTRNSTLLVKNRMHFTDTEQVRCFVEILKDYTLVDKQIVNMPVIDPQMIGKIDLKDILKKYVSHEENYSINLHFEKEEQLLGETEVRTMGTFSSELSKDDTKKENASIVNSKLSNVALTNSFLQQSKDTDVQEIILKESARYYEVKVGAISMLIDKSNALIKDYKVNQKLVMEQGPVLNLFRAYTDNDKKMLQQWIDMHLNTCSMVVYSTECTKTKDEVLITFTGKYAPNGMNWGIHTSIHYLINSTGNVEMKIEGEFKKVPDVHLPKIGAQLVLSENFEEVTYCGMGPMENYSDRDKSASAGIYKANVYNMDQPYDYPQEYGNRTKVHWVNFYSNKDQTGMNFSVDTPVDFAVRPFSDQQLFERKHSFELQKENKLYVNLDYKNAGLGSASCGPERLDQYQVYPLPFRYSINFMPYWN
jgi:beta-galactosidase/beta-glucuronidase